MIALCYHPKLGTLWGGAEAVALHILVVCLDSGFKTMVVSDSNLSPEILQRGADMLGIRDLGVHELMYGRARRMKLFPSVLWRYNEFLNSQLQLINKDCELYINRWINNHGT